jgi:hypothetical protein
MSDIREIKVLSLGAPESDPFGRPEMMAKVVFQVCKDGPEFPILVSRKEVSDEHIILVARHYLHMQASALAEATASWRLRDEEYKKMISGK